MKIRILFSAAIFAFCCSAISLAASPAATINERKIAAVVAGVSTKAQVRSLLGAPWRTVQYNDLDEVEDEIWEYRGTDSQGSYRIHIEFDHRDIVRIVQKLPEYPAAAR